ncbi:MAG TPA: TetR family transcriptional regulator C-terminal domain-containing protein [Gallionellaceae bacterium]
MTRTAHLQKTTRDPDATRDAILEAAFQEMHRHGFQAASLSTILAKTDLTKGALYHHFPTKNDLGLAVIEEVVRAGFDAMVFSPLRDSNQPFDTLLEIIRRKGHKAEPEGISLGCPLNNLMQEMSPLDADFKASLSAVLSEWQETVSTALARAQKQGHVRREVDCRAAALFIVSAWEGCEGVAKNLQSVKDYRLCMKQLEDYVAGLAAR